MTLTPTARLRQLDPFSRLNEAGLQQLENQCTILEYRLGQPLCDRQTVPNKVLVILEGQARLLGRSDQQQPFTAARLESGAIVGLASLLRGEACELVSAASPLIAAAIPDAAVVELYQRQPAFRDWCQQQLWPAELLWLAEQRAVADPHGTSHAQTLLEQLQQGARLLPPQANPWQALKPGEEVIVASANLPGFPLGERVAPGATLTEARGPFAARLVAAPAAAPAEQTPGASSAADRAAAEIQPAPRTPERTALDLGQAHSRLPFRPIRASGPIDETLASLQMLCQDLAVPFRRDALEKVAREAIRRGQKPNLQLMGRLCAMVGLHPIGARVDRSGLTRLQTPCLMPWQGGFALVLASNAAGLSLASPSQGMVQLAPDDFAAAFPEEPLELLLVDRTITTPEQRFGPSWFWPAISRYRTVLIQVLVASLVVQLFTLANPLLIQVIIDKVINQRSLDTLQVLGLALVVVTLLEGLLTSLRTFLFTETTNRIDLRLGAEVIDHLLRLPLNYFDKRPVGELATRVGELQKIRSFLTGQALTSVIDTVFSVIYIVVMLIYSWVLTIVALVVVPIQVAITVLGAPLFRRQYRRTAEENARTQSHLVEVLGGIQTVKAQNVEMVSRWKWQQLYGNYVSRTFEQTLTGTALSQSSQVLQKISQLVVLWVGASMVLQGELTLGQLIAFRIISGYVTQPLLRLSTLWQDIQQLRISFERLADVVDTPEESDEQDQGKIPLPPIHGRVVFDKVTYRYAPGSPPVLRDVSLEVEPGMFIGVVGQSGSGKSTLMKLISRLYAPEQGRVLIDGYDIDKVELYSLRRQIGIVPQDPLLFAGTVSENIALTDPDAGSEKIVAAARLAGAHDFIMELPAGYSTPVGERGSNLSGGQRQRIAIARTLLSNPKMLVMDEATSALDYDTERRVCDNLHDNLKDCTVFFITHRLSTIRRADRIVMLDQGSIAEVGTHSELMDLRGRYYALYRQQEGAA